jgi:hypothetical protein
LYMIRDVHFSMLSSLSQGEWNAPCSIMPSAWFQLA